MRRYFFNEKRAILRRQATHSDRSGELYKHVNGKLYMYKESAYLYNITHPCWIRVDDENNIVLMETPM